MIIKSVERSDSRIIYWYYVSKTALRMTMREFYYSASWLPDLITNDVSIQKFVESYNTDFTHREFLTELLMLITEYQHAVKDGWMSDRVFQMRLDTLNYHLTRNHIKIVIDL